MPSYRSDGQQFYKGLYQITLELDSPRVIRVINQHNRVAASYPPQDIYPSAMDKTNVIVEHYNDRLVTSEVIFRIKREPNLDGDMKNFIFPSHLSAKEKPKQREIRDRKNYIRNAK